MSALQLHRTLLENLTAVGLVVVQGINNDVVVGWSVDPDDVEDGDVQRGNMRVEARRASGVMLADPCYVHLENGAWRVHNTGVAVAGGMDENLFQCWCKTEGEVEKVLCGYYSGTPQTIAGWNIHFHRHPDWPVEIVKRCVLTRKQMSRAAFNQYVSEMRKRDLLWWSMECDTRGNKLYLRVDFAEAIEVFPGE